MKFTSTRALRQLLQHGVVATMRQNDKVLVRGKFYMPLYYPLKTVKIRHGRRVVGLGVIAEVVKNNRANRIRLLPLSGFRTVEEWESEAIRIFGRLPNSIVVVILVRRYG